MMIRQKRELGVLGQSQQLYGSHRNFGLSDGVRLSSVDVEWFMT